MVEHVNGRRVNLIHSPLLRFILHAKKTGFVVEHDFIMATYLADRVIVFEGTPSVKTLANRWVEDPATLLGFRV